MMIWSALHENMQLPKRAASELASRREHMVKRAGFMLGIGRELYTAPFIWVPTGMCDIKQGKNGRPACYDKFRCEKVRIESGQITGLSIYNDTKSLRAYVYTKD